MLNTRDLGLEPSIYSILIRSVYFSSTAGEGRECLGTDRSPRQAAMDSLPEEV